MLLLIALFLIYLIHREESEGWTNWISNLLGLTKLRANSAIPEPTYGKYNHNCMTCKPYGYQHLPYYYFKEFGKNFPNKYRSCNNYRCKTKKLNGYTAKGNAEWRNVDGIYPVRTDVKSQVDEKYYNDPHGYCQRNPDKYPCPNFWVKNSELAGAQRIAKHPTQCMFVPGLKKGVKPQVKTPCNLKSNKLQLSNCNVNDTDAKLIVLPGTADHALCRYARRGGNQINKLNGFC